MHGPRRLVPLLSVLIVISISCAEESPGSREVVARGNTSDELLAFQELPVVVSASRQAEPLNRSSTPVSVVTAEDIHLSGLTTVPEVLRFVPGVDVLAYGRNRYAVGVRGGHDYFSDRTLTMIDGRNAESPVFGGSEFLRYPLLMEDIERIEVVRGPGGGAWGANAFNGVINVITKKPEDTQGVLASTTVNEFGESSSHVRWGAKKGKWAWRTSFGYQEWESSESVIHEDRDDSRDFYDRGVFDGVAAYRLSDDTRISFGAGYQYQREGDFEFLGYFPRKDVTQQTTRAFVRADHRFSETLGMYVQWFGNFADTEAPQFQNTFTLQNDLEMQFDLKPAPGHHLSLGGNVRWMQIDECSSEPQQIYFPGEPSNEYFAGLFALYRWQVSKPLTFEAQVRGDWYSETQTDWAGRLSVLFTPDAAQDHCLRFSGAKAFRTPLIGLRDFQTARIPLPTPPAPPGLHLINGLPNGNLENEEVWSFEIGYTGRLTKGLTLRADGYYQRYQELIGFRDSLRIPLPFPPPYDVARFFSARNIDDAEAWGGELELTYQARRGQLSAWYAFHEMAFDRDNQSIRAYRPARNSVGFTGRLFLPHEVTLNLNYRYTDVMRGDPNNDRTDADPTHRLDLTASKRLARDRFELMIGVTDVLDRVHEPVRGIGSGSAQETPGRTFFGRFQMKF